jgi:hypothetical protein
LKAVPSTLIRTPRCMHHEGLPLVLGHVEEGFTRQHDFPRGTAPKSVGTGERTAGVEPDHCAVAKGDPGARGGRRGSGNRTQVFAGAVLPYQRPRAASNRSRLGGYRPHQTYHPTLSEAVSEPVHAPAGLARKVIR